jgi:hypothetical protein
MRQKSVPGEGTGRIVVRETRGVTRRQFSAEYNWRRQPSRAVPPRRDHSTPLLPLVEGVLEPGKKRLLVCRTILTFGMASILYIALSCCRTHRFRELHAITLATMLGAARSNFIERRDVK